MLVYSFLDFIKSNSNALILINGGVLNKEVELARKRNRVEYYF